MIKHTLKFAIFGTLLIALISCQKPDSTNEINRLTVSQIMNDKSGANDFEFLTGKIWSVKNKVLNARLANSDEWSEFDAESWGYQEIAGGFGHIDHFKGVRNGVNIEASSVRAFDKNTQEWSIYWMDNIQTKLLYQVTGKFENGVGTFYGEEPFNGEMTKLRFLWTDISDKSARWEQAYYDSLNSEWETNWIMEFTAKQE